MLFNWYIRYGGYCDYIRTRPKNSHKAILGHKANNPTVIKLPFWLNLGLAKKVSQPDKQRGMEGIGRLRFLASFGPPSTGKRKGSEKMQPFNRIHFLSQV